LLILTIIPTYLLHLILRFSWDVNGDNTSVTTLESIVTMLLLPIYLLTISYFVHRKCKMNNMLFIFNFLLIIFCIWLSAYFHFENWLGSMDYTLEIDEGTIEVMGFTKGIGYIVCSVGFTLLLYLYKKNK